MLIGTLKAVNTILQIFDASLKKKKKKKKTPFDIDSAFDGASGSGPAETVIGTENDMPEDGEIKELDDLDLDSFGKKKKKTKKKAFPMEDIEAALPDTPEGQEGEGGDEEELDLDFSKIGMKKKKKKKITGLSPDLEKDEINGKKIHSLNKCEGCILIQQVYFSR